jgi:hypothetical protein
MMSAQENDLITRIGPGTSCGSLMRRYWQPAALVDELEGPRPVKPVRLLGENLVLFRDEQDRHGLLLPERRSGSRRAERCGIDHDRALDLRRNGYLERTTTAAWVPGKPPPCRRRPADAASIGAAEAITPLLHPSSCR